MSFPFSFAWYMTCQSGGCLHVFLRLVLRIANAHRHMDVLTRRRRESLLFESPPDSFRYNGAIRACCHGQQDGEFFAPRNDRRNRSGAGTV